MEVALGLLFESDAVADEDSGGGGIGAGRRNVLAEDPTVATPRLVERRESVPGCAERVAGPFA